MAETITIEIPINVKDNTSSGVKSAQKSVTALEKSIDKMNKKLEKIDKSTRPVEVDMNANDNASSKIHDVESAAERVDGMSADVELSADDNAIQTIHAASDATESFDGQSATAELGADDSATQIIHGVSGELMNFDGHSGTAELGAHDNATPLIFEASAEIEEFSRKRGTAQLDATDNDLWHTVISAREHVNSFNGLTAMAEIGAEDNATQTVTAASDTVENFDGQSATAEIGAEDNATQTVTAASDTVENFDGQSATAEIGAEDNATQTISGAMDLGETFDGSVWTATVSIVDAATAPLQSVFNAMKNPITQAGTMLGVSVGVADSVGTFKDYESMMSQVKAISGASGAEFDMLNEKAKQMGADTKFSAFESAEAFNYMAMAGWKTKDMMGGIEGIMSLAAASGESLGTTSDIVTDALTAFGLKAGDASHFSDVLAQASSNANTNVGMLGESFKYVAPVAGAMNYTVEDTSLALGLMANASIKGSMAGTALKSALANLSKPVGDMPKVMDKYNISLLDSEGNMKSLKGVMDNLRGSLGDLSETEQMAAATTLFGKEAAAAMLTIINASTEDYGKLTDAVYNADGAAKRMADTMMDNHAGSIELLGGAVDEVKMSLGERLSPYLRGTADALAEQMPGLKEKINEVMDEIDKRAAGAKRTISEMVNSEEWQDADLFGKVNIAWDKIVAEPFKSWAGGTGKSLMSEGLSTLFSEAAKILPGGEDAGIMSWLSAGVIAKGTTSLVDGAGSIVKALQPIGGAIRDIGSAAKSAESFGGFISSVGSMIPMAGKIGLAAAGITAAIVAIGVAIDNYNQKTLSSNLAEHFGQIELSAEQAELMAKQVLTQDWLVNVEVALGEVQNADNLADEAEEALKKNRTLEWKSKVGIKMDPDEQAIYTENIETFAENKIKELESRSFAAHLHVQTFLGGTKEGETLSGNILEWANADNLELSELSSQLSDRVSQALEDGIIGADEGEAIRALQEKMNSIVSRWKEAESEAQLAWIKNEYGTMSAEDLTAGGFDNLITALRDRQQTGYEKLQADYEQFYTELAAMNKAGRISGGVDENGEAYGEFGKYVKMAGQTVRNQKAKEISTVTGMEIETLQSTYGDKISENLSVAQERIQNITDGLKYRLESGQYGLIQGDLTDAVNKDLNFGNGMNMLGKVSDADQANLSKLWESMAPDAKSMARIMDEYAEAGQAAPESYKNGFVEMMKVGAAAGDVDAAWQMFAHELVASADQATLDALNTADSMGSLPEEFSQALKRELMSTVSDGETLTLDDIQAKAEAGEIEVMNKDEWVSSINEKLGDLAEVSDVTAEDVTIKVKSGDCLWEIGDALGVDWKTIAEQNGIESPYTIYPDQELVISRDGIDVDASSIGDAIDSAMSALTAEGAEFTVSADGVTVDLTDVQIDPETAMAQIEAALGMAAGTLSGAGIDIQTGGSVTIPQELVNVDTSGMAAAVEAAAQTEPVETETSATVTAADAVTDASGARASSDAQIDEAFATPHETDSDVDVTLSQTNNADAIYSEVDGEIQGKFAAGFSTSALVSVTLDWKIVNPTANISVGGAGTGSASVSASIHAAGGEVGLNGPELSWVGEEGLEYIIPTVPGRRGRGIALWEQAGQALGVLDSNGQIAGHANGGIVGPGGEVRAKDDIFPIFSKENDQDGSVWTVTGSDSNGDEGGQKEGQVQVNASPAGQQASGNNIEVKVEMNPVIKIDGGSMDEQKVFDVIKDRCRELADDLGGEIAERMTKIFENMPIVQGA